MATDYDAPRKRDDGLNENGTEVASARRSDAAVDVIDLEPSDNEPLDLPGADLSGEELIVHVVPRQADEFTCSRCFLVHHQSRLAQRTRGGALCLDCA